MAETRFNPFDNRLARDIRNGLSEAFAQVLVKMDMAPALKIARHYLETPLDPIYENYIHKRLCCYEEALSIIRNERLTSAWDQALVLWDLRLFFEVHEILEDAWLEATGTEKLILQAMIRAAGMYIKLYDQQNERGARKMAGKAADALEENREALPENLPLDLLLIKLRNLDPSPPLLRPPAAATPKP